MTSPTTPPQPSAAPDNGSQDPEPPEQLRKDLDAGLRFAYVADMQMREDLFEASTRVFALLEELIGRGALDLRSFEKRLAAIQDRELDRMANSLGAVKLNKTPDKYAMTELPEIDCAALQPLCKSRCCTLTFPLSVQDINERVVSWEYGKPYQIRQGADGYCVHCDSGTGRCGVYDHRPAVCRAYDCRSDKRIWADFEKRIPAEPPAPPAK